MSTPAGRVLVLGGTGQLGRALARTAPATIEIVRLGSAELDVRDAAAVGARLEALRPGVVINAAAWTAVDAAESAAGAAAAVNTAGAAHVARAAERIGARLLQVSTDFVFGGGCGRPLRPDDPAEPLSVYGRTKRDGEAAALGETAGRACVVRTAWLYEVGGHNFVATMLRIMRERESVSVVSDQVGTPTWARSLATALWRFAERPDLAGVFHWTDAGVASWYDFAVAIQEEALATGQLTRAVPVLAIRTAEYPTAARRPAYSVLDGSASWRALDLRPAHWRVNLRRMLEEMA